MAGKAQDAGFRHPEAVAKHPPLVREHDGVVTQYWREGGRVRCREGAAEAVHAAAVEVFGENSPGGVKLRRIADQSGPTLKAFLEDPTAPGTWTAADGGAMINDHQDTIDVIQLRRARVGLASANQIELITQITTPNRNPEIAKGARRKNFFTRFILLTRNE